MSRTGTSRRDHGGRAVRVVGAVVLAASLAPVASSEPLAAPSPDARPVSDLFLRSSLRPQPQLETSLTWRHRPRTPDRIGPGMAFRRELREEAIDFQATNPWANAPDELLDDEPVRSARRRAAEGMLSDALEAGAEVWLRDVLDRPRRRAAPRQGRLSNELRLDTSPSWRVRRSGRKADFRLDVPLAPHDSVRLRWTRMLQTDRRPHRFVTSVSADPWDESIRLGFSLEL